MGKVSAALRRQGSVQHLWLDSLWRTACRSRVGSTNTRREMVTCDDCLNGRTAEDTETDVYGRKRKGQVSL